jgi:predicted transglutaminase-like cysteine proteinase
LTVRMFGVRVMKRRLAVTSFAMVLAATVSGYAQSSSEFDTLAQKARAISATAESTVPYTAAMPISTRPADVPSGYIGFCARNPDQCEAHAGEADRVALTATSWAKIRYVNRKVNAAIWPVDDMKHYGRDEYWTLPTDGYGDCEDFALLKRKILAAAGLPEAALRIAVVQTPRDVRHAVLTVVTDRGDFVLDSMTDDVLAWNQTGFVWLERQDPAHPLGWVSLSAPSYALAAGDATGQTP